MDPDADTCCVGFPWVATADMGGLWTFKMEAPRRGGFGNGKRWGLWTTGRSGMCDGIEFANRCLGPNITNKRVRGVWKTFLRKTLNGGSKQLSA